MPITNKHRFRDEWLAKALIYYQIVDEALYEELTQRFVNEEYFYDVLVKNNYLLPEDIVEFVENALKISAIDLDQTEFDREVFKLIPEELCRKYLFIPFHLGEKEIYIASFDPTNLDCEREIETLTGRYVKTFFAFREKIEEKINTYYSPEKVIDSLVNAGKYHSRIKIPGERIDSNPSPVVKLVNQILEEAINQGASDIHIEPKESVVDVRIRVDGVLRNIMEVPKSVHPSMISRIKIISDLNIAETRKPQDGKAKIYLDKVDIDLRVSILPTSFGEKAVIRVLDKRRAAISLENLGIRGQNKQALEKCFSFKQGMILVTGPTGSGKSTTLYAAINRIKSTANNILTIEDPIEYVMEGVNQVQVNEKAGVTFASALRSFLRQDPDVILVGEIRDQETAEIAIQAAQTGHLVLSTLHTNDTFGTITRLLDMGIDKFKITESVQAIIAQRLVRKLCPKCKVRVDEEKLDAKLLYHIHQFNDQPQIYEAKGCPDCNYSGYKGRTGVYEILILNRELKDKINANVPSMELRRIAKKSGFRNLFEDALALIADGVTDYREVLRTINPGNISDRTTKAAESAPISETSVTKPDLPQDNGGKSHIPDQPVRKRDDEIRVLVVEDYKISRLMLRKMIEKKTPWKVQEAEDGVAALQKIVEDPPDVVLLDIMMPRMDGYELLQHLRAEPSTSEIPVLLLTSLEGTQNEVKGFELGADDYLTKPIKGDVLIARIKRVLSKKRMPQRPVVASVPKIPSVSPNPDTVQKDDQSQLDFKLI